MASETKELERSLTALEARLGLRLTVIDNAHVFDGRNDGKPLFPGERRSHRKNPACAVGFDERCVQHCRYAMNTRALSEEGAFVSCCWKGLIQFAAPLRHRGIHYGNLFGGLWRSPEHPPPAGLAEEFYAVHAGLPEFDPERDAVLGPLFELAADGVMMALLKHSLLDVVPDERSARIAAFLREHAAEPIGLGDLAVHLGLSNSRTSFIVGKLFHRTFTELLLSERVERVKQFLAGTDLKLARIAGLCGFSDEFHLSRVFKRFSGRTPSEFRAGRRRNPSAADPRIDPGRREHIPRR